MKDINDKGLYKQFLLHEIKNSRFKLDNIRVSVRTEIEKDVKIGDQTRLSAKLFPLKISSEEYSYNFARVAYYQ